MTLPVVAPAGIVATIDDPIQLVIDVAVVPLKITAPVPCVAPKRTPVIVTGAPTAPEVGDRLVMLGAPTTVKNLVLLATPPTVTTTVPEVAPVGTVATIDVAPQLPIVVAVVPLNVTVLVPCVDPKLVPVIVTDAPTAPNVGDKLVMLGVANAAAVRTVHTRTTPAMRDVSISTCSSSDCYVRIALKTLRTS
jgi:exopolysaccharide biosynthesis predicted pyruvyltransferase EpsI